MKRNKWTALVGAAVILGGGACSMDSSNVKSDEARAQTMDANSGTGGSGAGHSKDVRDETPLPGSGTFGNGIGPSGTTGVNWREERKMKKAQEERERQRQQEQEGIGGSGLQNENDSTDVIGSDRSMESDVGESDSMENIRQ